MSVLRGRLLRPVFCTNPQIYSMICDVANRPFTILSTLCNRAIASFEEVKSVKNDRKTLLIDVREPQELQETGVIPGSINIPLGEVETVLKRTSPEDFLKRYGKEKPGRSASIIFSCKSGKRSADAQDVAAKLGFDNTKNYLGGWLDWEERNK
jgi:rhodanese-related sulfurtransferase